MDDNLEKSGIKLSDYIIEELEEIERILGEQFTKLNSEMRTNVKCSDIVNNERKNNYITEVCDQITDVRHRKIAKIIRKIKNL